MNNKFAKSFALANPHQDRKLSRPLELQPHSRRASDARNRISSQTNKSNNFYKKKSKSKSKEKHFKSQACDPLRLIKAYGISPGPSPYLKWCSGRTGSRKGIQQRVSLQGKRGESRRQRHQRLKTDHQNMQSQVKIDVLLKQNESVNQNKNLKIKIKLGKPKPNRTQHHEQPNPYSLSPQDYEIYGDRFPHGFRKTGLLGQGGFAVVWAGRHLKNDQQFAVKQISTSNQNQTHKKQIWFGTHFFEIGGNPKKKFAKHPGINSLLTLITYQINFQDSWLIYQRSGVSLGKALYELQECFPKSLKSFKITYKPLYQSLRESNRFLLKVILQVAQALDLLAHQRIVHSDLKTENILVEKGSEEGKVKLIDYGSAFQFIQDNLDQFTMATPEYMSPELLNFILFQNKDKFNPQLLTFVKRLQPWSVDIWSLGCVILQIIHGLPVWMSYLTQISLASGKRFTATGAFAVQGRKFDKIIQKQLNVTSNLQRFLQNNNFSGCKVSKGLQEVLTGCLQLDPNLRISPKDVIKILQKQL